MSTVVNKDKELGIGSSESGTKLRITDAKGPRVGGNSYWLCPTCNKVVYSIWRDGPMADETRNKVFCTCEGEQNMLDQEYKVTVFDIEDVTSPKEAKEFRAWLKEQTTQK